MFDARGGAVRTTLAIDDDVLRAAKQIAAQERRTIGEVISDLARKSLRTAPSGGSRNGIPLLNPRGDVMVTLDIVNALRDEAP